MKKKMDVSLTTYIRLKRSYLGQFIRYSHGVCITREVVVEIEYDEYYEKEILKTMRKVQGSGELKDMEEIERFIMQEVRTLRKANEELRNSNELLKAMTWYNKE